MTDNSSQMTVGLTSEENVADSSADIPLGICCVSSVTLNLANLRDELKTTLPALPEQFQFVTEKGWPILENQEGDLHLSYLLSKECHIRIKALYGKPRIGIRTVQGTSLGFIFIELYSALRSVRNAISDQLGDSLDVFSEAGARYQFVDLNKWPISYSQEKHFRVLDVVRNSCVHIFTAGLPQRLHSIDTLDGVDSAYNSSQRLDLVPLSVSASRRGPVTRQLTFRKVKDVERVVSTESTQHKQVLLSYVRAEAASHALKLKTHLTNHGYSVYLDVHEIQSGEDWQDALNSAVTTCQAFVPLVTSRYGETMWTNREVKLADVLSKPIIPVSFMNTWPPRCLAIQFATTQFVYWKPNCDVKLDTEIESLDISRWEESDVTAVASQIAKQINPDEIEVKSEGMTSILKKNATLRSCPAKLPVGFQLLSQNREGRPLVVVSVHPAQKHVAIEIKSFLQIEGYEVWCSIQDQLDTTDAVSPTYSQEASRHFERTISDSSGLLGWSQCSQTSEDLEGNLKFQEKADEAGVIIVVLSKAFAQSKRCKQQVFYCEHRKKIIPVKYEDLCMPGWMSILIGTGVLQDAGSNNFEELLKCRIKKSMSGQLEDDCNKRRVKINAAAAALKEQLPAAAMYVYISGGTKFYHKDTESICKALGAALAGVDDVHVVTGGFYGVGATVAQAYVTQRTRLNKPSHLWNILPIQDHQDRSHQGPQNKNRRFRQATTGRTLFSGDSVRERESIVSQVFHTCVLIEGGPGAAHEAEEFVWNDGIVVPVECTGGAAGGKFNVPEQIFEIPVGVGAKDWYNLRNIAAGPQLIAQSITSIVHTLTKRMRQCKASGYCKTQSCPSSTTESNTVDTTGSAQHITQAQRQHVVHHNDESMGYNTPDEGRAAVKVEQDSRPQTPTMKNKQENSQNCQYNNKVRKALSSSRQATLDINTIDSDHSTGFDMTENSTVEIKNDRKNDSECGNKEEQDKEDTDWFTKLKNNTASKGATRSESPKKKKHNYPPLPKLTSGGQKNITPVKLNNSKTLPARLSQRNGSATAKRTRQNVKSSAECVSNSIQNSKKPKSSLE